MASCCPLTSPNSKSSPATRTSDVYYRTSGAIDRFRRMASWPCLLGIPVPNGACTIHESTTSSAQIRDTRLPIHFINTRGPSPLNRPTDQRNIQYSLVLTVCLRLSNSIQQHVMGNGACVISIQRLSSWPLGGYLCTNTNLAAPAAYTRSSNCSRLPVHYSAFDLIHFA
ncbi:hypothetical protein BDR03DRAFT_437953 [Suillus americanus]|nr:hypothetical protein BDR03DRAFT_437953 [Suillus americanus]